MKAVRLLEYGGQLVFNDVPTPTIVATRAGPLQNRSARRIRSRRGFGGKVFEEIVGKNGSFLFGDLGSLGDHARNRQ
jgi:hypothetical protein